MSEDIEEILAKLGRNSSTRYKMDKMMGDNIFKLVSSNINELAGECWEHIDPAREKFGNCRPLETSIFNDLRDAYNNSYLKAIRNEGIDKYKKRYYDTTQYGKFNVNVQDKEIEKAYMTYESDMLTTAFIRFTPGTYEHADKENEWGDGNNKEDWNDNLKYIINSLIGERDLPEQCRSTAISTIKDSLFKIRPKSTNEISWQLFEYVYSKIAERTENDSLVDSLRSVIGKERTIRANPIDLASYASNLDHIKNNGWNNTVLPIFGDEKGYLDYKIYGDTFTVAYINILSNRMSENIRDIINNELSQELVRETIEYLIKFFQKKDFSAEDGKIQNELNLVTDYEQMLAEIEPHAQAFLQQQETRRNQIEKDLQEDIKRKQRNDRVKNNF